MREFKVPAYLLALITLSILCGLLAGLLLGIPSGWSLYLLGFGLAGVILLAGLGLVWAARRWSAGVWVALGLLLLLALSLPAAKVAAVFFPEGGLGDSDQILFYPIVSIALLAAALLLFSGLDLYTARQNPQAVEGRDPTAAPDGTGWMAIAFPLGALLLAKALHSVFWLMVWDNTRDSLGYFWLAFPVLAAVYSAVILSVLLAGRARRLGGGYFLLVLALLVAVSAAGQRLDYRQLTRERAARVSRAIERYYARNGRYPRDLRQLSPGYALALPGPVILTGQDWCYDGGGDYYRLGYVDREHWSDPRLIGRIYKVVGTPPDLPRTCEPEVAAIQEQDPDYPYQYWMESE